MQILERISSPISRKPYRTHQLRLQDPNPALDQIGHLAFSRDDIENPHNWSQSRRWFISSISILLVISATFASSGPSAVLPRIAEELHVSEEAAGLITTVFLAAYSGGPLLWAPLSEHCGRRWIFVGSFLGYTIFIFLCAFAPSFGALLVGRLLTGVFAS